MSEYLEWTPSERYKEMMEREEIDGSDLKDALTECYITAMAKDRDIALSILRKQFKEANASWEDPSIQDIKNVMDRLADVSRDFRSEKVVKRNYQKMMKLIDDKILEVREK